MKRLLPLLLTGAAAAAVGYFFARDLFAAQARLAGRTQKCSTRFGLVEYALQGEEGAEPVLLVHGASGGFDQALDLCGDLAGAGYRLIAPSRFGYLGSSNPAGLTTGMQADAYAELLDHLGVESAAVVAVSAGAWSAIEFAIRHPGRCRALVLLVPANPLPAGASPHGGVLAQAMMGSDFLAWAALKVLALAPDVLLRRMLGVDPAVVAAASPEEQARTRQILEHLLPAAPRARGALFDIRTAADPGAQSEELIACPVLALSAQDDPFNTAARARSVAAAAPDGAAVVYPDGGHPLVGRHDQALADVTAFLAGPARAGRRAPAPAAADADAG